MENSFIWRKLKNRIAMWSRNPTPGHVSIENSNSKKYMHPYVHGFPSGSNGKESTCNADDLGSIPRLGRFPGEGQGNPLQYSCLENPHRPRSLAGLQSMGSQRVGHDGATKHIYSMFIAALFYNRQDLKITQVSIDRWMDKEDVVHI